MSPLGRLETLLLHSTHVSCSTVPVMLVGVPRLTLSSLPTLSLSQFRDGSMSIQVLSLDSI